MHLRGVFLLTPLSSKTNTSKFNRAFLLMWPSSVQIWSNKRERLHKLKSSTLEHQYGHCFVVWNANIAATTSCENAVFDLERTDSIKRVLKKSQVLRGL